MKHFVDVGIDSITYLPHPSDPNRMESVIKYHSSFSLESVRTHSKHFITLWDGYDRSNDRAATECLLSSLERTLYEKIEKKVRDGDTFVIVWMRLMGTIQLTSYEHFENLKKRIKGRRITQYAGQDVSALCKDFKVDANVLTLAGAYKHTLTLNMVKILLEGRGDDKQ